jgi:hypothetical protein
VYLRRDINKPFAMEIIIVMCWSIWKERNTWLFNNEDPSVESFYLVSRQNLLWLSLEQKGRGNHP